VPECSVGLDAQCVPAFEDLKLGKKSKFIIYTMSDDKKNILVDKISEDPSYDNFLSLLPEQDCRYAVYDFEYELGSGEGKRLAFPHRCRSVRAVAEASDSSALQPVFPEASTSIIIPLIMEC
jgi:hypothetical protein